MSSRLLLALLLGAAVILSGCSQAPSTPAPAAATPAPAAATPAPAAATPPPAAATAAGTVTKTGSSVDFAACIPGTPWEYAGASAAGGYTYTWKIEGKTDYKGSSGWCKVVGKATGAGVPAGYSFEYYFKGFDATKGYTDLCYKINLGYAGAPPQEACVITGGVPVTPGK
ncbi:MAG: hypothetical protein HY558_00570 [Euryarchaeota archaeon]|nr:hypothetical protein [Euryarchaeota archaeon]